MNWYKTAQQKENWIITKLVSLFGAAAIMAVLAMPGMSEADLSRQYQANPQQVIQEIQQVQQAQPQQGISEESLINRLQEGTTEVLPIAPVEEKIPTVPEVAQPSSSGDIDLNKIWQIESTSGKDPGMHEPNSSGALGHFQFLKGTWNEMVGRMGKNWDWETGALDYNKSKAVSDYYLNKRIPAMLGAFNIPDTIKTRIACYSWGIGHLKNAYEEHAENWEIAAPQETKDYFVKYGV